MASSESFVAGMTDWCAVAREYEGGALSVTEICARHGVSKTALYQRLRAGGWRWRRPAAIVAHHVVQDGLGQRLFVALDAKMRRLEGRLAEEPAAETAADGERDARTLNTLVRLYERLKSIGDGGARGERPLTPDQLPAIGMKPDDAERLRNDLAQRLEALRGQLGG